MDAFAEAQRVARRVGLVVVVEVHVDIRAFAQPAGEEVGPTVELGVGVAAAIEGFVSVQPHISEIGGANQAEGKFPRGVGCDQRDVVLPH